MGHSDSKIH